MSRLGLWFLELVRPFPRTAAALHYVRNPGVFVRKVASRLRRWRSTAAFRRALDRGELVTEISSPPADILFTVATPVYRVAEDHLRAAIESVRRQSWARWEHVLLDDASPDPHVRRVLAEAAARDPRVRVVHADRNLGIAAASDRIGAQARGDFVAYLDHDDLLHPRALELVARRLKQEPDVDWLFTDEDKVDEEGRHREPCFKPGWSHQLLLTFNYVCHFRVVRRTMLGLVGGHRQGFDGAQDYDLALRVLAAGGRFAHLPGVLYHWRTVPGSMARAAVDKPAAHGHALRALREHAESWPSGGPIEATVLLAPASFFRVRRAPAPGLTVAHLPGAAGRAPSSATDADVVAVAPPGGWRAGQLDELLALLQVPGTAVAAGRAVAGTRVVSSGYDVDDDGRFYDPWRGLHVSDPGYLNLAMVPGRRLLPPGNGFVAWSDRLEAAWQAASDVDDDWRIATGLHRLDAEIVVAPTVSVPAVDRDEPRATAPDPLLSGCRGSRWHRRMMNGARAC